MTLTLIEYIILLPIVAAIAILLGSPPRFTALAAAVLNLAAGLLIASRFKIQDTLETTYHFQLESSHALLKEPALNLAFGVDGISLVLVLLTVIVTVAAVWASPAEDKIKGSAKLYYISSLLISAGALGAFCATDLFFFYAFHELALIPTFLMIGFFGHGEERRKTAWTITIYLGVGSLILLVGLLALFFQTGGNSFSFADMAAQTGDIPAESQQWIFLTLLIGFGILVSLFPFHSWAPPAYASAPAPIAMLHAGVLKKFGLYGLIRVALPMLPEGAAHWANLILILLLGNILVLGLVTIAQRRLDTMLGYSSVMHMGFAFLGIASLNVVGISGAVLLMFAHGVSIALAFVLLGSIRERTDSLEFDKMAGGLGKAAPMLGLLFGLAAFASIGLPGFANFASEVMVFFGGFKPMLDSGETSLQALQWATILSLWGVVISAVYMLRAYRRAFMGPRPESAQDTGDLGMLERIPALLLVVALIAVGFVPSILLKYLTPTLEGLAASLGGGG